MFQPFVSVFVSVLSVFVTPLFCILETGFVYPQLQQQCVNADTARTRSNCSISILILTLMVPR